MTIWLEAEIYMLLGGVSLIVSGACATDKTY
jgi:hypothetical protein